jgi:hypothetical protein
LFLLFWGCWTLLPFEVLGIPISDNPSIKSGSVATVCGMFSTRTAQVSMLRGSCYNHCDTFFHKSHSFSIINEAISKKNKTKWTTYRQGNIEFVVDNNEPRHQEFVSKYLDSCFLIARLAVNELNKSLSYKMNDQIRLFFVSDSSSFELSILFNQNPLISRIHISDEIQHLKRDIRYYIAKHYLQEYLGGILLREKLSPNAIKPPIWLVDGFCNYFSKSLTFNEFEQFSYLARQGKFDNINFIESQYQELFGTIVWYLFEKEKGLSINGAFWLLLKNANSFERTFYFNFEQRFSHWLKLRVLEIESMGFNAGINSDVQISARRLNINRLELDITGNNLLIYEDFRQKPKIKNIPIPLNNEIFYDSNWKERSTSTVNLAVVSNDTFNSNLMNHLKYKLKVNGFNSTIQVAQKINQKLLFAVIRTQCILNDSVQLLGLILNIDNSQLDFQITHTDTLFKNVFVKESIDYENFISESTNHFSFIRKSGNHSEVNHYIQDSKTGEWKTFAMGTKGYFYQQKNIVNSENYLEFYLLNNEVHFSVLVKNSEILISDTIKKVTYSFDTIKIDSTHVNKTTIWNSNKLFVSPFEFNKNSKSIPRKNNEKIHSKQNIKAEPLRNWHYTASSNYYFSNRELDLGYNSSISVDRLYNAPITLFYEGYFPSLLKNSSLSILAFSNINRRRIGIELQHKSQLQIGVINQIFKYRLRQFSLNNSTILRNRSLKYEIGFYRLILKRKHNHRGLQINSILKSHLDQIIPLNMGENSINLNISNTQLHTLNLGVKDELNFQNDGMNLKINYLLNWENGFYKMPDKTGITSAINGQFNLAKKYRMFLWETGLKARYSLSKINSFYWILGNNGWIEADQFVINSGYNSTFTGNYPLQQIGGNVRGIQSASRGGTSFFNIQSEISVPVSSLIPSYSINGPFLKSLRFFIWGDAALAFIDGSPWHYNNPYNTLIYSTPNYKLTATANRDPWVHSRGLGIRFKLLEMDFRLEYGIGKIGDDASRQQFSISLGNIF